MKRCFCLLLAFIMIFSLSGCSNNDKPFTQKDITAVQLQKKINKKQSFIFIVERDGCGFCKKMNSYIKKTKDEHPNVTVYVLDSTDFGFAKESEEATTLISSTKDGKILLDICPYFLYTPAIYVVKKGKVVKAGIGFNDAKATVAEWDNKSTPDLENADYEEFWDFIENAL